ncbi:MULTISPECIES: glycogen debranching enzyme N-terminal domain-containing protein [Duncaniella]|jgi:predicted glycogen debranching enzyme|uniref:4-alpha-glucanotransferase n=3 Tax=Duncaniella TaxID=2518495 RepID=A0A4P7W112_9BACT|nr:MULTISPECIES: glycogen debranching enzyme N-terminal domain-containing protein [Duncaniella]MCX4284735.1 glycogen debranching enzyme N-terminal domain-containing protein [Duncaniella dubosii]QCD41432.1 4-alpha-glucanotransferase [Duncaniella dubosii]
MSYLKFDKNLMINLEQSLPKEMLRTNQSGAYHCTTIVDCNTRKQHGLLVVPVPELGNSWHVMLSSLDLTVYQHGAPFNLALHRYRGGVMSPNGHKYIREFDCESVPRTTYRVGGVILTKEKIFISNENRILIRYTLVEANSPTTLRFRPVLAFRDANELCVENNAIDQTIPEINNGVSACLYPGYPRLYMQFSHKPTWTYEPNWYNGFEYVKDLERGVPYCEDLWVPGYFEIPIKKGESIIFSAGLSEVAPKSLAKMYESEIAHRTCRTSFFNCLKNAVKQCYLNEKDGMYLISGYPWGKILARNTFMALPGATIAINHREDFERIADTAINALRNFMATGDTDKRIIGIDLPDVSLWAVWALQQYAKAYGRDDAKAKYLPAVRQILDYIIGQNHPFMKVDDNGMLVTDGNDKPMSWMNASLGGRPVVARTGLLVEFNALWYNALVFASKLSEGTPDEEKYAAMAERMAQPFVNTFLNDYGYLYDYVNGTYADPSVRPNMAIAIGLDYSPLDRRQRKKVLDIVTRELLTPKGLRTLSPKSYGYRPCYLGSPEEREMALHNGPARPWLMGFYSDAYLKVFGMSGVSYVDRMLIGFEDEMTNGCIGSLSQLYDANPPYTGRGAISHVTNVAEVLRTLTTLKKFIMD